ncbi:PadR family transcriptional regulator [Brachybacterium phenoliresistens]|uniref:Transcriptional regulator n=1 Tax=Brachybacterium phenoliresistens TaxID=396014 RepID=Z9JTI9_9MICO|nr:PadR family transcriptional regulator [Brachybacterium phenoliresistens]EWS81052.1 transcriptional regulator [Brachybacterium phenoliresistens]
MIGADAIRGHIDLILLAILETRPSYAYELSQTITDRSGGEYVVKQTTLYTAVKRLESQGLLDSFEDLSPTGKPRTYYRITASGTAQLEQKRAEWISTRALVDHFALPDPEIPFGRTGQSQP